MVPALTVIIVSYNTSPLTLRCLQTLYAQTTTPFRTILFDNASTDGSADAVAAAFPQVVVIRSDRNLGFAAANNRAADAAETDWLLLLNPDTEVLDGAVDRLLAFAKDTPGAGITGGRTVFADGSLNIGSCWMRITPWSLVCSAFGLTARFPQSPLFNPEGIGGWRRDSRREVDIVSGCFLMIPRALWHRLGGFRERYFMYGEDADLCLRARGAGYRPAITPDACIVHLAGASSPTAAAKLLLLAKGRATLIADHWPPRLVPLGRALMWCWAATRYLAARAGARSRPDRLGTWRTVWQHRRDWLAGY